MAMTTKSRGITKRIPREKKRLAASVAEVIKKRPKPMEAPDWGEPIGEAPESHFVRGAEAPDAGEATPYEGD